MYTWNLLCALPCVDGVFLEQMERYMYATLFYGDECDKDSNSCNIMLGIYRVNKKGASF